MINIDRPHTIRRATSSVAWMIIATLLAAAFGRFGLGLFRAVDTIRLHPAADTLLSRFFIWVTWLGTTPGVVTVSVLVLAVLLVLGRRIEAGVYVGALLSVRIG